ncbi:hypothetical protein Y1Q_0022495 [Alligator mississippiensis]|uniref:Uncharacterized protein n=1 Tax=Alligator mississippiensis TaxID=8496 RepID=A0A151N0W4_ALLMI|nr:hypothetical protein Y1Q_0022495 [Alligator mississippiensis]
MLTSPCGQAEWMEGVLELELDLHALGISHWAEYSPYPSPPPRTAQKGQEWEEELLDLRETGDSATFAPDLLTVGCGDLHGNSNPQTLDSSLRQAAFNSSKISRTECGSHFL